MEDCSHGVIAVDPRLSVPVCLRCRRTSYEIFQRWCGVCSAWQMMLIQVSTVPPVYACARCQTPLPADAPRRKEIRWAR